MLTHLNMKNVKEKIESCGKNEKTDTNRRAIERCERKRRNDANRSKETSRKRWIYWHAVKKETWWTFLEHRPMLASYPDHWFHRM